LLREDCLFCRLVRDGEHVFAEEGFVAIRDIAPKAETHLLVLPERHIDTFRAIGDFPDEEAGRMLRYVGPGGGQTVFHLHWHVLGGRSLPGFE
jgi:histidine triad (HIT) family protein